MSSEERLENIEFRMDLLYENTPFSRYLYECKITRKQLDALYTIMGDIRQAIENGENVNSSKYEADVLSILNPLEFDYHFCELFAKFLWEEGRYDEVFPRLYGESLKYKNLFK